MADGVVQVVHEGGIARVTLDRPPLNLFEPGLIAALREAFEHLARETDLRVIVLTGAGRAFQAGMDVNVLRALDVASAKRLISSLHAAIAAVHEAPVPVVARINGAALGAGFELALACDLRVAVRDAPLGLPEVQVGVPSVIEAALLPAAIGPARAAELLFTGDPVRGDEAATWGLVNRAVAAPDLDAAVDRVVARIVAAAPAAIRLQKELVARWRETDLRTAVQYGINAFATAYATDDAREGASAFLEKREPRWRARP
ncbi:MAG: enoyl-CoA hydratase/isomerase family protein [Candidatus Rokubacteria bacterium]|nr:enoyl-CoA hydratase/isomerase family protein [Candidatus Rokubacteria bacterium]